MLLDKKSKKLKEAIRIQKRLNYLYTAKHKLPKIKLEKPIRSGWVRYYVLRGAEARSNEAKTLNKILDIIQNKVICPNKEFLEKNYKTGKREPVEQELKGLDENKFLVLDEQYKKYFFLTKRLKRAWRYATPIEVKEYVFSKPYLFEFKIKPHFITEVASVDVDIEREIAYLGDKFQSERMWQYMDRHSHDDSYGENKRKLVNKMLAREMKERE